MVRTLEQSGQARLGTRPASLRFSVYPKQIIDNTPVDNCSYPHFAKTLFPTQGNVAHQDQVKEAEEKSSSVKILTTFKRPHVTIEEVNDDKADSK